MKKLERQSRGLYQAARMASVGLELALSVVIGYFGGKWLEERWGFAPWGSIGGLLLGFGAGLRSLWRTARPADDETDNTDEPNEKPKSDDHD